MDRKHWPWFYTATIYKWQHLLAEDKHKDIIIDSLKFQVTEKGRGGVLCFLFISFITDNERGINER